MVNQVSVKAHVVGRDGNVLGDMAQSRDNVLQFSKIGKHKMDLYRQPSRAAHRHLVEGTTARSSRSVAVTRECEPSPRA